MIKASEREQVLVTTNVHSEALCMLAENLESSADLEDDFFLRIFANDAIVRMVHASLTETQSWGERKRRLPAPVVVWLTLMLALHRSLSIPNAFLRLQVAADERWPGASVFKVTDEALCHARVRVGFEPLMNLFGKTAEEIQPEPSFAGMCAWVIDGTTCNIPDTEANEEHFGRPKLHRGKAAFPQLKMVPLTCVSSRRVKQVRVLGCRGHEVHALRELLPHVPRGDVVFVDRGLASYGLVPECQQLGIHVVMRVSGLYKPRIVAQLGPGDYRVEGTFTAPVPPAEQTGRRKTRDITIKARMIVFRFEGDKQPVRLLTTLSPEQVSARELAEGYHLRWEVELEIGELKTHLSAVCHGKLHTTFRSKSPMLILQEVFALLATYNLVRSMMVQAAVAHGLDPLRIGFVGSLEVLKATLPYLLLLKTPEQWKSKLLELLDRIAAQKLPRPRRPRRYPRKVKQKMSNFKLKRAGDLGYVCDFKSAIQLDRAS